MVQQNKSTDAGLAVHVDGDRQHVAAPCVHPDQHRPWHTFALGDDNGCGGDDGTSCVVLDGKIRPV